LKIEVYRRHSDPKSLDIVIEYLLECSPGEVSVKLAYSSDPARALESTMRLRKVVLESYTKRCFEAIGEARP